MLSCHDKRQDNTNVGVGGGRGAAAATHEELPISIFVYICLPLTFITARLEYNSIIFIIRSEARTKEIIC